jgi:hypothetical protein
MRKSSRFGVFLRRHRKVLSVIALIFGGFPAWVQMVWALFSSEPLLPWLWSHKTQIQFPLPILLPPPLWVLWITVPIGLVFLILIWRQGRAAPDESARPNKPGASATLSHIAEAHVPKPVRIVGSEDNYLRDSIRKSIEKSEEAEERRAAVRRTVLESAVEYISEVKRKEEEARLRHPSITLRPRHIDMLDVIMRAGAHKLERESDVIWLCDKLVSGGHKHPFEVFEREYSPVRKGSG